MKPTKAEFQELIDECNIDRFQVSFVNTRDIEGSVKKSFCALSDARQSAYKMFLTLPAYQWMTKTNKTNFDRVKDRLFPLYSEQFLPEVKNAWINSISNRFILKIEHYEEKGYDHLTNRESIIKMFSRKANVLQSQERMLVHIVDCFKEYMYPSSNITPADFNIDIDEAIKISEKVLKSNEKLKKYEGVFLY